MRRIAILSMMLACLAVGGAGGLWFAEHRKESAQSERAPKEEEKEADKPVVSVRVVPLRQETIRETFIAYGSVIAEPGEVHVVSVPFEARVVRLHVIAGETVVANAKLAEIEPSPDAMAALQEARNAAAAATNDLAQAQHRFDQHLATNVELSQARQAEQAAKLKLQNLVDRGVGTAKTLTAVSAGIVSKIDAQEGQLMTAGAAVVELAATNRFEVRLGIEPGNVGPIKLNDPVALRSIDRPGSESIDGHVRKIGSRVDPATRLVEVRVALPENSGLLLDSFVTGEFSREAADAFVIPIDAALPAEDDGYSVFTVEKDHAVKHLVKLGLRNDRDVQIIGEGFKNMPVVSSGNYLLDDGMEVEITESPATAEPGAAPSTSPAEGKS